MKSNRRILLKKLLRSRLLLMRIYWLEEISMIEQTFLLHLQHQFPSWTNMRKMCIQASIWVQKPIRKMCKKALWTRFVLNIILLWNSYHSFFSHYFRRKLFKKMSLTIQQLIRSNAFVKCVLAGNIQWHEILSRNNF